MKDELPQIATQMYSGAIGASYTADNSGNWVQDVNPFTIPAVVPGKREPDWGRIIDQWERREQKQDEPRKLKATKKRGKTMADKRRLVRVYIVDPEENVPLDKCLVYKGDEQLTDSTDEELFFEIPVKELLDKHNEKRVKMKKEKSGRKSEYLKKARIRDLKMVVVTVAEF